MITLIHSVQEARWSSGVYVAVVVMELLNSTHLPTLIYHLLFNGAAVSLLVATDILVVFCYSYAENYW